MTSPQGINELLWGREHEDVNDWVKRLTMVVKVRNFNANSCLRLQNSI
jgi:hypothetical protein